MKTGLLVPACLRPWRMRPGQRADVGAAVAADLRLVAHAAERDAHELAAHRARDRAAERGLARRRAARRSTGSARASRSRSLRTPRNSRMRSLMPVEVRVVLVEDARARWRARAGRASRATTAARPATRGSAHHLGLGAVGVHALEAAELAGRLLQRLGRESRLLDACARISAASSTRGSTSPSSVWIARSCSRRKCSRWPRVISSLRLRLDLRLHGR